MPEAWIGLRKFERRIKFSGAGGRDQLDFAIAFLGGPDIFKAYDLALVQRGAHLHQGAMRVQNDGMSLFREDGLIGPLPFHDHAHLKKQPLAASFV